MGDGKEILLLVHGYGCDQNMWRYVVPAFKHRYKIVLIDLVGAGNSDVSAYDFKKYSSLDGYATDLVEMCLDLNFTSINLIGHSVSAMIGLLACIKQPQLFKSFIMLCPSACYINKGDYYGGFSQGDIDGLIEAVENNYLGWASAIAPTIINTPEKPEVSSELANSFCRTNPDIAKHFAKVTFLGDNRADLVLNSVPTLVVQCNNDLIAPTEVGEYVHQHMKNSSIAYLDTTGHCPHLSAPEQTIAVLKSYFEGIPNKHGN